MYYSNDIILIPKLNLDLRAFPCYIELMKDYYTDNVLHPMVNTSNKKFKDKRPDVPYKPISYLQDRAVISEAVTGQVAEVRSNPALEV